MRKFNLKGTVVERMKGITREDNKTETEESVTSESFLFPGFTAEQGMFSFAWRTDIGRLRKNNQDAVILGNGMAGVADGMGGHNGGEIASAGLREGLLRETKGSRPDRDTLENAIKKVNRELWIRQENDHSLHGMGTTLTVIWPTKTSMIIGQIGDSRAYLLRDDQLIQITEDHSMVADMVRKGVLTEEQAACHPMRNYITRAVGTEEDVEIDLFFHDRQKGDQWLVCSDGLHGMISRTQIKQIMQSGNLEEKAENLLQTALAAGGKDNISLILVRDETDFSSTKEDTQDSFSESFEKNDSQEEVTAE